MAGKFSAGLRAGGKRQMDRIEKVKRLSAIALFDSVALATPVKEGRLRGNWQCSLVNPKDGELDLRSLAEVNAEIRERVGASKLEDTLWLTNNLPYAERIEYDGWSGQAPAGMVRINAANWERIVASVDRSTT